jgi:ATP-dependent Clp protease protease subunit
MKKQLNKIYSKHTGRPIEYIEKNMERDNFMNPQEALEFGLIDKILVHPESVLVEQKPTKN